MAQLLLLLQLVSTLAITGLIWFVQLVHYPLFACVGREGFCEYERQHQRRTTWIVAPLMLVELASALLWPWFPPAGVSPVLLWVGALLAIAIWVCTAVMQMPAHAALCQAFDAKTQASLVRGNWWRTVSWTARSLLVCGIWWQTMSVLANVLGR